MSGIEQTVQKLDTKVSFMQGEVSILKKVSFVNTAILLAMLSALIAQLL